MNFENDYYPDVVPHERLQMLQNNADNILKGEVYQRPLSEEEIEKFNSEYVQGNIVFAKLEDELDEIKESYKVKMKPVKETNRMLLQMLKTKQEEVVDDLFEMFDHERGIATIYNSQGQFISSRRMRTEEKQKNIFSIPKAANE
jgi:hypothetical protein